MIYIIDIAMKKELSSDGNFLQTVESLTRRFDINNSNDVTVLELGSSKDTDDNIFILEELLKMSNDPLSEGIFLYRDLNMTKGFYNTLNMIIATGVKIDLIIHNKL